MSKWKECKLADVAEKFAMGPFGSNIKAENFKESGVPVIRGANLNYYKYISGNFVYISEEKANELKSSNCFPGDLVFTHRGTIGQVGLVPEGKFQRYVVSQSGMKVTVNNELVNNHFLLYFFKSERGQHELLQHESQVGVPSISNPLTSLKSVSLLLPPLHEQRAIASIFSSLDDKIDLLHCQNKTLEAIAETLFRQCFVEEESEGEKENSLLELIRLVGGGTPSTSIPDYWNGNIPWLSGCDIASNHKSFVLHTERSITEKGLNNSSTKLLPKYATVISARGTVGKYCLLAKPMAFSQSNYGILPRFDQCYFFTYLMINYVVKKLQLSAYGSVFDTITTSTFKEIKVSIPNESKIRTFENTILPYFNKICQNAAQISTIEKMRNILLPKLINGEVRISI